MPKIYLDDQGNPNGIGTGVYLDENGNPQAPPEGDQLIENIKNIGRFVGRTAKSAWENPVPTLALAGGIAGTAATGGALGPVLTSILGSGLGGAAGAGVGEVVAAAQGRPNATTARGVGQSMMAQGAGQAAGTAVGLGVGKGLTKGGELLMEKAVKPTRALLKEYRTTGPAIAKTLLNEGVNVTPGGLAKLQALFESTNDDIASAVASASGSIPKTRVAAQAASVANRVAQQTNPTADLAAVGDTVEEFLKHPVYKGDLSVAEAQAMKRGTYREVGKKYGQMAPAAIETQKALARGLKEEVAAAVPGIDALNARDSALMAALDATGNQVAIAGRKDPVGFAWVTQKPLTFLAALADRSPMIKSALANGAYREAARMAGVSANLVRAALAAVAGDVGEPD